jgi:uncharacterized protein YjbI with pentapeptide repeats
VLILAVALQSNDDIGAMVSSGRLQWAIACAHQFAGTSPALLDRLKSRLSDIEAHTQHWLPEKAAVVIRDADHLQQALATLADPYLGRRAVCADKATLVAFDLDHLPLANMKLRGARLMLIAARGARLELTDARGAMISRSCLQNACLRLAVLTEALIRECDLSHANLEGTTWCKSIVSRVTAHGALLFDSDLSSAQFTDCDFRDADFQGFVDRGPTTAQFVSCDLRRTNWHGRDLSGVSFVRCKLHGAFGGVKGLHLARLESNDMSADGDGSLILAKDDLLKRWGQMSVSP